MTDWNKPETEQDSQLTQDRRRFLALRSLREQHSQKNATHKSGGVVMASPGKHTDVFNGAQVRMAFRSTVRAYAQECAMNVEHKYIGNMISSQDVTRWTLPEGSITWTGGAWGVRATLHVHTLELRAAILKRLGVDLRRSRIYSKFAQSDQT